MYINKLLSLANFFVVMIVLCTGKCVPMRG